MASIDGGWVGEGVSAVFAIIGGLVLGWLLCGFIWALVYNAYGYKVNLFDFYFVWRWKR